MSYFDLHLNQFIIIYFNYINLILLMSQMKSKNVKKKNYFPHYTIKQSHWKKILQSLSTSSLHSLLFILKWCIDIFFGIFSLLLQYQATVGRLLTLFLKRAGGSIPSSLQQPYNPNRCLSQPSPHTASFFNFVCALMALFSNKIFCSLVVFMLDIALHQATDASVTGRIVSVRPFANILFKSKVL